MVRRYLVAALVCSFGALLSTSARAARLGTISLWLGGKEAVQAIPAYRDASGEVYAPALDAINSALGSSLNYEPGLALIAGPSPAGRPVSIAVAESIDEGLQRHTAFVVNGRVFVPLHALALQMSHAFAWNPSYHYVSLLPRLLSVSIVTQDGNSRVELHCSAPLGFVKVSYYDSPWRVVLDLTGLRTWPGKHRSTIPGIVGVRWQEWPSAGHVRVVVQLVSRLAFAAADSGRASDYWLDVSPETPAPASLLVNDPAQSGEGSTTETVSLTHPSLVEAGDLTGSESAPTTFVAPDTKLPHTIEAPDRVSSPAAIPARPRLPVLPVTGAPGTGRTGTGRTGTGELPPATVTIVPVVNASGVGDSTAPGSGPGDSGWPTPDTPAAYAGSAAINNIESRKIDAHTTEVTISASGPILCHSAFYDSPSRLVLDVPNTALKLLAPDIPCIGPGVKGVRTANFPRGSANSRIVLDLTSRSLFQVLSERDRSLIRVLVREMQPDRNGKLVGSPVAGHTICIDPGHCDVFHGARGLFGLKEEEVTLDVGKRLAELLQAAGANVVMTRWTPDAPSGGHDGLLADLIARAQIANRAHADLFLSIHCDAMPVHGTGHGSLTIYGNPRSEPWASMVYQTISDTMGHGGTGTHYRPQIKVTEYTNMPSTLAELGFLDTKADAEKLIDPNYRQTVAENLLRTFEDYYSDTEGLPWTPDPTTPAVPDNSVHPIPNAPAAPSDQVASRTNPPAHPTGGAGGNQVQPDDLSGAGDK